MAASIECVREHKGHWEKKLQQSRAQYRNFWPRYLFRHEAIENAISIIGAGALLSRNEAAGYLNIAAPDIIAQNDRAHAFARLYFRPRTPTQYHIEGIRKRVEYYHGVHAPVLVMLVFDAEKILTRGGTQFSNGNMQSSSTMVGETDDFLKAINFEDVYHTFPVSDEDKHRVVRARCAEVLANSPLELNGNLVAVLCRSSAERNYLLHLLGAAQAEVWAKKIFVHTESGIFEKRWAYVDTVDASSDGFLIGFHPRADGRSCEFDARVYRNDELIHTGVGRDADLSKRWRVPFRLGPGVFRFEIDLDDAAAYRATHLIDEMPF